MLRSGFRTSLLLVALATAFGAAALTWVVAFQPFLPIDAAIERDIQSVDVGPLSSVFAFYTAMGGPLAIVGEALLFGLVLVVNRRAWRLLVASALASAWYFLIVTVMFRPRPSVPDVLRVTEHPGASSYPSGHMIMFVFYGAVLMLCVAYRFLPRTWLPYGWMVAALLVILGGISRIYSGAHWPSDVLAGALIGVSWTSLVVAVRSISDPALARRSAPATSVSRAQQPLTT